MPLGVDESEVTNAELRLRQDRVALAEAMRAVKHRYRTTLTQPSTLALLLVVGGLAGARSKRRTSAADKRGVFSILRAMLATVWQPLLKGAAAVAVERAFTRPHEPASVSRPDDPVF